jgi:hypothetical protein
MAKYFVFHKHNSANHKEISGAWETSAKAADQFKGQMSYCSCPSGKHEVFAIVEASSENEARKVAPAEIRDEVTVSEVLGVPI